ncbi:hypothetical protein H8E50_01710 [bacterium]|nr:hypothetical protein [bacterium]
MNALVKQKDTLAGIELLEILKIIANKKDAGLLLHEFSADNRNIIIKGTALSFEEIEKARNSLATAFAGAKVIDSKAGSDGRISFTIIMENLKS